MQEFLHTKKPAAILLNILFELLKGNNNLCVMQTWINLGQKFYCKSASTDSDMVMEKY